MDNMVNPLTTGIKTGYNDAFIIDNETKEALIREDPKSAEIIKPVLRGRDIKRYQAQWAGLWMITTLPHFRRLILKCYPVDIKRYLLSFGKDRQQTGIGAILTLRKIAKIKE